MPAGSPRDKKQIDFGTRVECFGDLAGSPAGCPRVKNRMISGIEIARVWWLRGDCGKNSVNWFGVFWFFFFTEFALRGDAGEPAG